MRTEIISGLKWVFAETLARNVMLFGFMIALTRLLDPEDFGLIAMLGIFVGIAAMLSEGGLGAALIQEKQVSDEELSTLFWTQIGLAATLAACFVALGPALAGFMGYEQLGPLAAGYAAATFLNATGNIQKNLLMKHLWFRGVSIGMIAAQLCGGILAIVLALQGFGPWAIVGQAIATAAVSSCIYWLLSRWRPTLTFSGAALRKYARVGGQVVGIGAIAEMENRLPAFILGVYADIASTGFYQRGGSLQLVLTRSVSGIVIRVAFPAFSRLQDKADQLLMALRGAVFVNTAVTSLVMWTIAVSAEAFIELAFGAKWLPTAPVFQALCISAASYPVYAIGTKALRATGRTGLVLRQHLVRLGMLVAVTIAAAPLGVVPLAQAIAITTAALTLLTCLSTRRHLGYRFRDLARDLMPVLLAGGAIMIGVESGWTDFSVGGRLATLLFQFAATISLFCAGFIVAWLLMPSEALRVALKRRTKG